VSFRLAWSEAALDELARATAWSRPQAEAVVNAMEWMAETGFSLGRPVEGTEELYWPVPPLGVFYALHGDVLEVLEIVDRRRRTGRQPDPRGH